MSQIVGSIERQPNGTYLVKVEVEGVERTFHLRYLNPPDGENGDGTMFKDRFPVFFQQWLEAAGGSDEALESLFKPHVVAAHPDLDLSSNDLMGALGAAHQKIASGIAEAEAIRERLPLA